MRNVHPENCNEENKKAVVFNGSFLERAGMLN
jgi:hypothetical protein